MWIKYNANPVANRTEDCAIRAVAVALDIPWDDAFDLIARSSKAMGEPMDLQGTSSPTGALTAILWQIFAGTILQAPMSL